MTVNIEWLINQNVIKGIRLLAGEKGKKNEITAVNVMDNPDTVRWIRKGELLLSTGYFLEMDPLEQEYLIPQLSKRGCAGLGIKMKRYLEELPEIMRRQAEELGFPILELPYDHNFSEINDLVYRSIFEKEREHTAYAANLYREITDALTTEHSLEQIIQALQRHLNNPVFLTGTGFQMLAYDCPDSVYPIFQMLILHQEDFSAFSAKETELLLHEYEQRKFHIKTKTLQDGEHSYECQIFPVTDNGMLLGFLCVLELNGRMSRDDYRIVEDLQGIISLELLRSSLRGLSQKYIKNNFVQVLLGQVSSLSEIEAQCDLYGFPYLKKRVCLVIRMDSQAEIPPYLYKNREETFSRLLFRASPDSDIRFFQVSYNNLLIVYCMFPSRSSKEECMQECLRTGRKLIDALGQEQLHVEIGVSECHSGAAAIREEFEQGLKALKLGKELHPEENLYSYQQDAIYHLLKEGLTDEKLLSFYENTVQVLDQYDAENHSDLADTLRGYFEWNQNITTASQKMYIHRNTLSSRLEKIKEILGNEMNSQQECLILQLGLYARTLIQIEKNAHPGL